MFIGKLMTIKMNFKQFASASLIEMLFETVFLIQINTNERSFEWKI